MYRRERPPRTNKLNDPVVQKHLLQKKLSRRQSQPREQGRPVERIMQKSHRFQNQSQRMNALTILDT
ncbi:hypothetical protein GWO18_03990 [Candidatus Bathyarchaeota archaeon]|nr:hypothetical protein [Candidatus Bathyarchaeota archaeon]NIW16013.1 hypothetical protein [Candidatus Bathyarchaeota archaeon]